MYVRPADWCVEKQILVPLTTSLYVPGTLADQENVIVDVGTGFYVEKVSQAVSSMRRKLLNLIRAPKMLLNSMMTKSKNSVPT
jgi:prefoldin alpha subunit